MKSFLQYINEFEYCQGLSLNVDFFWDEEKPFLTVAKNQELVSILKQGALAAKMNIVDTRFTKYGSNPAFGFSYLVVLGQSHMMVHTWPEAKMMNIDIFTCGNEGDPQIALNFIKQAIKPNHLQTNQAKRGIRKDLEAASEIPDSPKDLKPVGSPTTK